MNSEVSKVAEIQENPYSALLKVLRDDADSRRIWPWRFGEVVSVEPLVIETGQNLLSGRELWVNYQLRENQEEVTLSETQGSLNGSVDCEVGGIGTMSVASGLIHAQGTFHGVLVPGDRVVLLQNEDAQEFVVLCKVVTA